MDKKFKVTNKSQNVYQIERADKPFPLRYLVQADSDEKAAQICIELATDTKATVAKYEIDVCGK